MLFMIAAFDKPGMLETRRRVRQDHLGYLGTRSIHCLLATPMPKPAYSGASISDRGGLCLEAG